MKIGFLARAARQRPLLTGIGAAIVLYNVVALLAGPPAWSITPQPLHLGPVVMTPPPMPQAGREFTVASSNTLRRVFERADFRLEVVRDGAGQVPRLYLAALPNDLDTVASIDERKRLFIRSVLPLVLRVNREIAIVRTRASALIARLDDGEILGPVDKTWLLDVARRYGVVSEEAAFKKLHEALDPRARRALLLRIDGVPAALALAQAIVESGWGRSRFARDGNALFGQWTWDKSQGIAPADAPDADHAVRKFKSLSGSVRGYMHNLNTHPSYADFRRARARGASPLALAEMLTAYSERGQVYVDELLTVIDQNDLLDFESTELGPTNLRPVSGWFVAPVQGSG